MLGTRLGPLELILILFIALMIFGPSKLPEMGKAVGRSLREFKKATRELTDEVSEATNAANDDEPKPKKG